MPELFDKLETPNFEGMTRTAAWAACEAWENWAVGVADDFSDDKWDEVVCIISANYNRFLRKYGR